MAFKAQQATGCEKITALADRGYFILAHWRKCWGFQPYLEFSPTRRHTAGTVG
jgi:hypothetical protein